MDEDDSKELRMLIDTMQSGLVELFEQLGELRKQLELVPKVSSEAKPSVYPLFSEVAHKAKDDESDVVPESASPSEDAVEDAVVEEEEEEEEVPSVESNDHTDSEVALDDMAASSVSARVSRVLDPIAHELRTGEATADILLEYLQSAKEYLIDDDERKARVARDIDVVLKFLRARGSRGIRDEERSNILKRMDRWKAHLVAYASSPAG